MENSRYTFNAVGTYILLRSVRGNVWKLEIRSEDRIENVIVKTKKSDGLKIITNNIIQPLITHSL